MLHRNMIPTSGRSSPEKLNSIMRLIGFTRRSGDVPGAFEARFPIGDRGRRSSGPRG
jgi:hypothetical protein